MRGRGWVANKGLDPDNRSVIARASLSPSSPSYLLRHPPQLSISLGYTAARLSQTFRVVEQSLPTTTTTTTSFPSRRSVYKSLYTSSTNLHRHLPDNPSKTAPNPLALYIYIYMRNYTASLLWRAAQSRNIILLSTIWWVHFCTSATVYSLYNIRWRYIFQLPHNPIMPLITDKTI